MAKFNPYREWLNLDAQITAPNYYRLLGLEDLEEDPAVIQAAAAATLERVQSCNPGSRTKSWSKLVAEVEQAGKCLTDEWTKGDYDRQLDLSVFAAPQPVAADPPAAEKKKPRVVRKLTSRFEIAPETANLEASLLPPGMGGAAMVSPEKPHPTPEPPPETNQAAGADTGDNVALVFHSVHKDSVHKDSVHKDSVHKDAVHKDAVHKDAVHKDAVHEQQSAIPAKASSDAQTQDAAVAENADDPELPAVIDPDTWATDDKPTSAPVSDPVTFNEISASESIPAAPGAGDVRADPMLPTTNPMAAYQAPRGERAIETAAEETSGELSAGDIPLATALSSTAWQDVPVAQPTSDADRLRAPVTVTASTPPPPPARKPAPSQRGKRLGIAAGLAICSGILAFFLLNGESQESGPAAQRSSADVSRAPAVATESDPLPPETPPTETLPTETLPTETPPTETPPTETPATETPPAKTPLPDKQQLANLGQTLGMARAALGKGGVKSSERAAAKKHLKRAATLAQLPEHKDLVRRLTLLANYVDQFWVTLDRVVRGFQGGEELEYKDSIILVREKPNNELKIRYKVLNLSHRLNQLPPGIVMAIANHGFDETQPVNQVLKGAFLVVHPTSSESMISDAQRWWEEAAKNGVEIGDLTKVIDDDYLLKTPAPAE